MGLPGTGTTYGIVWGEIAPSVGGFGQIVSGLTTSRYLVVKPLSTNLGDVLIQSSAQGQPGSGFRLKPADPPVQLDLRYDNGSLRCSATANGTTLGFIGLGSVGD